MDELMKRLEESPIENIVIAWKEGDHAKSLCKCESRAEGMNLGFHILQSVAEELMDDHTPDEVRYLLHEAVGRMMDIIKQEMEEVKQDG